MDQSQRHKRLRQLIRRLNKERKRQASKTDILCNNLIGTQRDFLRKLDGVNFAASFYRALLGISDLNALLPRARQLIAAEVPGASVTFFLRGPDSGQLHVFDANGIVRSWDRRAEDYLDPELADSICKSNRPCTIEDLFGLGLQDDLASLSGVSMATLPLNDMGRPIGFVLIRRSRRILTAQELGRIRLITCGLSRAIRCCRTPIHSSG
jgi:hypothetical protein